LRIAALVKQVPVIEELSLGPDGRLVRDGSRLEMSAYCRRAVSKAVELAATRSASAVTVVTLGPPSAEDILREAVRWGLDRDVETTGLLITDPAFAGSDTLATARVVSAVLEREGPFDLVLTGRSSVDADTGQVPPQVAELLDLPFATGVKELSVEDPWLILGCEHDDQWVECDVQLPAVLSCAERLCAPAKVPPEERAEVPADRIRIVTAGDVGTGPFGQDASPTSVGATRTLESERLMSVRPRAPLADQVRAVADVLTARGALVPAPFREAAAVPDPSGGTGPLVTVITEKHQDSLARELLGAAANLAAELDGSVAVVTGDDTTDPVVWWSYGADLVLQVESADIEEDMAAAVSAWAGDRRPWAILAGSTASGREVASRVAARTGAGLTGDAIELDVVDGRLVAWKPAFGGQLVAAIHASSPIQMATVRAGVLPTPVPRVGRPEPLPELEVLEAEPRRRVVIRSRRREDDLEALATAEVVIGVGQGVDPADYPALEPLTTLLGAELGCTRKVTDQGWMAHARQIGITGRSIAPRLFVMIGASGKFNHTVGVRAAGTVVAINSDPDVPAWDHCDAGIVGDWKRAVPLLVDELASRLSGTAARPA
jgi:electron transfer flavoprotein alpha subunit